MILLVQLYNRFSILTTFVEVQLELVQVNLSCSFDVRLELGIQEEL